jgi:hypothetical protein
VVQPCLRMLLALGRNSHTKLLARLTPNGNVLEVGGNGGIKHAIKQREARLSSIRFLVSFGEKNRAATPKLPTKSVGCPRVSHVPKGLRSSARRR